MSENVLKKGKESPVFVLFGATGNLAKKKIFPALESLYSEGSLGDDPKVIAVSRRDWTTSDFLSFLKENQSASLPEFLKRVSYAKVDITGRAGYEELAKIVGELKPGRQVVYYSSVAPEHHDEVVKSLSRVGLLYRSKKTEKDILPKLLIEKPFGTDLLSAKKLDKLIALSLDEGQVYRVDHYLVKDTVMAVMDLHENTADLSYLFSEESVKSIRVRLLEEKGIENRGASYDHVGAFRDVGQNHMLEMLSVVATEPGKDGWQKARADFLMRLNPPKKTCELSRRGQYEGYLEEVGVHPLSETETAFEIATSVSSGKLKGVPLILESGKKMSLSQVLMEISFKDISGLPLRITFKVQPEEEIVIENRDGTADVFLVPKSREAYQNVIMSALLGCERCFAGREEIEALWSYADRIVECWGKVPLEKYGQGKSFLVQ